MMLLQLENTNQDNINKLLKFAAQNHIQLSVIDDMEDDLILPGKALSPEQLTRLIENSRNSGMIAMEDVHKQIRNAYDAD
jgi:molybdenum cofactor biosynthesis enzyme MoaA